MPQDQGGAVLPVELISLPTLSFTAQQRAVRRPRPQAAWGQPQRRVRFQAAASLVSSRWPGSQEQAQARAARDPVRGAERDQLRARLFNHRTQDRPFDPGARDQDQRPLRSAPASELPTPNTSPRPTVGDGPGAGQGEAEHSEAKRQQQQRRLALSQPDGEASWGAVRNAASPREQLASSGGQGNTVSQPRWAPLSRAAAPPAPQQPLPAASTRLRPDVTDMARAAAQGRQQGSGRGAQAGRAGAAEGQGQTPLWLTTRDSRYLSYFRSIYEKVNPLWSFPKRLEVLLEQGDVIVGFTIHADGSVSDLEVRKSSGFGQFDRDVVAAIEQAAPFAPLPPGLGSSLRVLAPFEFSNPMVR